MNPDSDAKETKSDISVPQITLPKGGGAIRGIGEKFATNPVTGTGSMNVPIFTSPGRSGFGPQLSLSYNSGSGNGSFGFGWNLSIPSITRKTDKGLPKYQDMIESDVFILSDVEDLVPVLEESNGSWEKKEKDRILSDGRSFKIHYYRPRIEGLFARIEKWTNTQNGDVHWRSISKDNISTIYGQTINSRIADPNKNTHIFSWLICESYDDKGNAMYYKYKEENSQGINNAFVHEKNRNDLTRSPNRYLKYIKYGNKTPRVLDEDLSKRDDWLFEVVFDYGEHYIEDDEGKPTDVFLTDDHQPWKIRHDPFSIYRSSFEIRSYRLCQRIMMFHHFPDELEVQDYLVQATHFTYTHPPTDVQSYIPVQTSTASFIAKITQSGYQYQDETGKYLKKSLPPLEFEYSQAEIQEEVHKIDQESLDNLPIGLDNNTYRWVDLDGEGFSGILTEQGGTWFYKQNLSSLPVIGEDGKETFIAKFAPVEKIELIPSTANLNGGQQQLMDLAGDGQLDLVQFQGFLAGFFERTFEEGWESFKPFISLPNLFWDDPNLKFVDLTGDGHTDILITKDQTFTWYPSLAEEGFGHYEKIQKVLDEESGPKLLFADGTQSIYLADLSGDGLTDLVRIRNGEVSYWPNLGYGQFGAKVTMDNSPTFDYPDQFSQQRVRLFDIDGSGTIDIIYLGRESINIYFNHFGNRWGEVQPLTQLPDLSNQTTITVVDLFGNGTACLVWSSPLPRDKGQHMAYIDLMGGQKPHLLLSSKNNMGAETRVSYASSTKFYLADKLAGKPWITRLPFPVHVVERIGTYDFISRNHFVTSYAYHHGFFDGKEREFRGFGMVEQWDTEEFGLFTQEIQENVHSNWDMKSFNPPVLTRTWFHTGASIHENVISKQYMSEYYREGDPSRGESELSEEEFQKMQLLDTILPEELHSDEIHDAYRSLKGRILRQEIYALDRISNGTLSEESDRPYTVSERNYAIKCLQPKGFNKHSVFHVHPHEMIEINYERKLVEFDGEKLTDPRITHQINLQVDKFGNIERTVKINYPRRDFPDRTPEQSETHMIFHVNSFFNSPLFLDWYRIGLPVQNRVYEIVKPPEPNITIRSGNIFRFDEIRSLIEGLFKREDDDPDPEKIHPYEKWNWRTPGETPQETKLRLIEHKRMHYRSNDLTELLPKGKVHSLALLGESYTLVFTPSLLDFVYKRKNEEGAIENLINNPAALLGAITSDGGGYVDLDGDNHWWASEGRIYFSPNSAHTPSEELEYASGHFFLNLRFQDTFNNITTVMYDKYDLLPIKSNDPLNNEILSGMRNEQGSIIKQNDYRVLQPIVITDPNKVVNEAVFDELGFVIATAIHKGQLGDNLENVQVNLTKQQIDDFFLEPHVEAASLLGSATTYFVYDMNRYYKNKNPDEPPFSATISREIHASNLLQIEESQIRISFSYSDGFGREIQKKIPAEPGPIEEGQEVIDPRWIGTGWMICNNKNKPIKKFEPFFDNNHLFRYGKEVGVSSITFYDPVERVVAVLNPNNTYEKIVIDPWIQKIYDVNDTCTLDPRIDKDIHSFVRNYFKTQQLNWQTWYEKRINGAMGAYEEKSAEKTKIHSETPTTTYFDTLGRSYLTISHNRLNNTDEYYSTKILLDIEGNKREIIDANHRIVMKYDYSLTGNSIRQTSMEAGTRWMLYNIKGKSMIRYWDSRYFSRRMTYDALQRITNLYFTDDSGIEYLSEKTEYGELKQDPESSNHRLKPWKVYDGTGLLTITKYDFKGNAIHNRRQLVSNYKKQVDWSESPESQLENEVFASQTIYDALNRLIRIIPPHSNKDGTNYNVVQPIYNEANLLERIDVWLEQENESNILHNPDSVPQQFVKNINYNAKGQRIMVEYGNRVKTEYKYDNQTYRLTHLFTTRKKNGLFSADCSNPNPCEDPSKTCPKPRNFPCGLQNLHYTYDPVGNITSIRDNAQYKIFFRGDLVKPENEYTYDAIYRLIASHGREHLGQVTQPETTWDDKSRISREHPNDFLRMRNYNEFYEYDNVGNIIKIDHKAGNGNWIRKYEYNEESLIENDKKNNRLSETILHPDRPNPITKPYSYDSHGNTVLMSHFAAHNDQENKENMHWDFEDQLQKVDLRGGGIVYYFYDASGNRIRKIHEHDGELVEERIYLGNFEIYRKRTVNGLVLERETLHILDNDWRVAIVETRTIDTQNNDPTPRQLIRYQHNNHLGTAKLELDDNSKIISYEEYYPYGGTSYQGVTRILEVPFKRYRYTGKERDEETGFYYYGKRYYCPWLGRWISVDPIGEDDHTNLYVAMRNNPIVFHDTHGLYSESGHYYTVYFVSLAAGFSPETAFRNAFFAQMPDEVKEMDAVKTQVSHVTSPLAEAKSKFTGLVGRLRAKAAGNPFASEGDGIRRLSDLAFRNAMQKGLHVLTGGKAQEETNFRIQELKKLSPGTPKFGFNLHAFGDSYSHRRLDNPKFLYKTGIGHGLDLTKPDKIHERSDLYKEYVTTLFQTLSGLSSQGKKITDKELAAFINAMSNETTEEGKISIVHKLAGEQLGVKLNPFTPEEDSNLEFSDFKKKYPIVDFKLPSVFEIAEGWARRPRSTPTP